MRVINILGLAHARLVAGGNLTPQNAGAPVVYARQSEAGEGDASLSRFRSEHFIRLDADPRRSVNDEARLFEDRRRSSTPASPGPMHFQPHVHILQGG